MKTEKLIASRYIHTLIAVFFASGTIIAWSQSDVSPSATAAAGSPLCGLTTAQLADFADGLADFSEKESVKDGLGPIFNNDSCAACHFKPAVGGSSAILETRFGRTVNGHFDPLSAEGGSLLQLFAINKAAQEVIPTDANVIAQRQTTPLFGLGLIEAIPDSAILEIAARSKPDGIFGRPSMVVDIVTGQTRVGRFGWKAQQATLLAFSGDAYLNEIGITSRLFPQENAPNGNTDLLQKFDKVPDPEDVVDPATGKAGIDHFTDFMRFLAPLPVPDLTDSAKIDSTAYAKTAAVVMTVTIVMFSAAAFTSPAAASARRTFTRTARAGSSFGECNSRKKKNARSDENRNESARVHCASDVSGRVNACPPGITIWSRLSAVNASFGQSTFV